MIVKQSYSAHFDDQGRLHLAPSDKPATSDTDPEQVGVLFPNVLTDEQKQTLKKIAWALNGAPIEPPPR